MLSGVTAAGADPAPGAAAEQACTSYTHVGVGGGLHVPSLGPNSANYDCVVVWGRTGFPVLVLQESLNACYGQGLKPDSVFGDNTRKAVRNAQTRINQVHGSVLGVDGRFGPKTSSYFAFQAYDHNNNGAQTKSGSWW
ncbi:peptidoglycan-binding domain-containing protein [Saccharothrix xinjiangensis]|uniref:Peptidoglycan-binding domain-containing protein n=1 Tax=Saccharothrix xinjiangensis TaxID=204798 RepID=A0ABV9Y440_9PSEU